MSHWVILTLGMVEQPLATAWANKTTNQQDWVAATAEEIETLGNQNPSNSGFIVLSETPGPAGLTARILPRSIDWELHDMLAGLPALQQLKQSDPEKHEQIKLTAEHAIIAALRGTLRDQAHLLAEQITGNPTYQLAGLSDSDLEAINNLIAVAELKAPAHISVFQFFVEDRLDVLLGRENPRLVAFRSLPAPKQLSVRRNLVELFGWQKLYPDLQVPPTTTESSKSTKVERL